MTLGLELFFICYKRTYYTSWSMIFSAVYIISKMAGEVSSNSDGFIRSRIFTSEMPSP